MSTASLHPRLELGSNEAIKQAILAGLGISALSRHALALNQPGQFAVLDVVVFPHPAPLVLSIRLGGSSLWWRGRFWIICWGGEAPAKAGKGENEWSD